LAIFDSLLRNLMLHNRNPLTFQMKGIDYFASYSMRLFQFEDVMTTTLCPHCESHDLYHSSHHR